jgi:hypothetical protein
MTPLTWHVYRSMRWEVCPLIGYGHGPYAFCVRSYASGVPLTATRYRTETQAREAFEKRVIRYHEQGRSDSYCA